MSESSNKQATFRGVPHSLIDQALLSAVNFLIGLVFIKFADKHDYYAYSQLIGYVALTSAIQSALVNTTALTLLPKRIGDDRVRLTNAFFSLQLFLSVVLAIAGGVFLWAIPASISMSAIGVPLAFSMVLMVLATWLREFLRNIQFINLRADFCLWQDVAYALILVPCIGVLVLKEMVLAEHMLLAISAAGILSVLPWLYKASINFVFKSEQWGALWREIWPMARWSLPAGLVAWVLGNAYLVIGANVIGPENTADIVAAKLFMAPLGMIFLSWANVFRPAVSSWLAGGRVGEVQKLTKISILVVVGVVSLYFAMMVVIHPYLDLYFLGGKYQGLLVDVVGWGVFFMASGISGVCNGVLLAAGKFRNSFFAAALSCVFSLPAMYVFGSIFSKNGLMFGVVLGEAVFAAVLYFGVRRMLGAMVSEGQGVRVLV